MKIKRLAQLASGAVLSLSSLLMISIPMAGATGAPYTCTWTGAGTDEKFSTAANWSGCNSAAPVAADGDLLVFPADNLDLLTSANPNNDLTNATFGSVTFTGTGIESVTLSGNAFTVTGGLNDSNANGSDFIENNITVSGNQTFSTTNKGGIIVDGTMSGSGNISKTGNGALGLSGDNTGYTGAITANAGELVGMSSNSIGNSSAPGAIINDGADFILFPSLANLLGANCQTFDFNGNLNLTGNSSINVGDISQDEPKLGNGQGCDTFGAFGGTGSYGSPAETGNVNLNGTITLGTDITFAGITATTTLTGPLSGAHKINMLPGYVGKLVVNSSNNTSSTANGTYTSAENDQTLSDSQPNASIGIYGNNVISLDGTRGGVEVASGGVLKGNGTTGDLLVDQGGTVSPGHSPGCLNTSNLTLNGTYQAEIGGTTACSGYDQLNVTGSVDLTGATLNASIVDGFAPKPGQSFTIINNDGSDAVTGTFGGLAEGGTFTANGVTFTITYKGGDGNDVVITDKSGAVPTKPNTGLHLVGAHSGVSMLITAASAGSILLLARRQKAVFKR